MAAKGFELAAMALGAMVFGACASAPHEAAVLIPVAPTPASSPPPVLRATAPAEPRPEEPDIGDVAGEVNARAPLMGPELLAAKGQVLVFHIWASWCEPCKKSMPQLQALYAKYKDRGLAVVALSVDDDEPDALAFTRVVRVTFPTPWDGSHAIVKKWMPTTMPTTYVVDRAGIVRFVHHGFHEGDTKILENELGDFL
jgi:thiol-disulfide isomerase/thioredoxin